MWRGCPAGFGLDHRTARGQVRSQVSQGTVRHHSFLPGVTAQRNQIGHLVQPTLSVSEQVEVRREVTCLLRVTCQVTREATAQSGPQSPASCSFDFSTALSIQGNPVPFCLDPVSTFQLMSPMLCTKYTKPSPFRSKYVPGHKVNKPPK